MKRLSVDSCDGCGCFYRERYVNISYQFSPSYKLDNYIGISLGRYQLLRHQSAYF